MDSIAKYSFRSPINVDNGFTNTNIAKETESSLELFKMSLGRYLVEWLVMELDMVEHIGIFCYQDDKVISDYDGVFEVPKEVIKFLQEQGFDCSYLID